MLPGSVRRQPLCALLVLMLLGGDVIVIIRQGSAAVAVDFFIGATMHA